MKKISPNEYFTSFSGVRSYLYLLINLYAKTGDPWFIEEINIIINEIRTKKIDSQNMDYFTGISSLLTVLSELYILKVAL